MPAVIEDIVEGVLGGTGWGLGLVAVAAAAAVGAPRAKPLAKQAIKGYFALTDRVRESLAEASEQIQDLYAEAKHEYQSQLADGAAEESGIVAAGNEAEAERHHRGTTGLVTPSGQPA